MLGLRLQETCCSSQVLKPWRSDQETSQEELFIKARQQSRQKDFYWDLMLKLDRSSIQAVFVKTYEIRNSRSDFRPMLVYLYRVSFLTTLDIYKTYFKGRHTSKIYAENALVHYFLQRNYCIFTLRVSWPMSFLIFIVDELKNFAANNLFKLLELVTYWDPCIIG